MTRRFSHFDIARLADDKALAVAAYGQSVAAFRYIVLAERSPTPQLRDAFEKMALEERGCRDRLQRILQRLCPSGGFYLSSEDKLMVCVGPRLLDARNDARFDEAMKLVIGSEKRAASFYARYAGHAADAEVKELFSQLAEAGLLHVRHLREVLREAGKQIAEPCPVQAIK